MAKLNSDESAGIGRNNQQLTDTGRNIDRMSFLKAGLLFFLFVTTTTGCVQRRLIVQSYPEGAFVSIDNQPIGYSPVAVQYTYAGTRDIQLEKDGYKTVKVQERIRPKPYDIFPISLITNNFWPREIRDERVIEFQLEPNEQVSEDSLLNRADDLRTNIYRGTVTAPIK